MSKDSTEAEKLMMGSLTLEYLRIRPEISGVPPIPTKSFKDIEQDLDNSQINTERLEQLTDRLTTETEHSEQLRNELEEKNKLLEKERQRENSNLAKAERILSQTGKLLAKTLGVPEIQTEKKSATLKAEEEIATTNSRLDQAQKAVTATLSEYPKLGSAASESADENLQVTYSRAKSHEKRHEYTEALKLYKEVAAGETDERLRTDSALMAGKILARDGNHEEAFKYFTQAAEKDSIAAFEVALCYQNGLGTGKDQEKAVEYYRKAADNDIAEDLARDDIRARAANNLGVCYEFGLGVEQNLDKASEMYEKSGLFNDNKRRLQLKFDQLATETIKDPEEQYKYALEIEKDRRRNPEHAFTLFKKAADAGHPGAAFKTAEYYDNDSEFDDAIKYYRRANSDVANYNIGMIYKHDKKDDEKAEEYFKLAAKAGNSAAEAELKIYEEARKPVTPVTITSTELAETPTTAESPISLASSGKEDEDRGAPSPLSELTATDLIEIERYDRIVLWHNSIMDKMALETEGMSKAEKEVTIKEILNNAITELWKSIGTTPPADTKERIDHFSKKIAEEGFEKHRRKGKGEGLRKFTKSFNRLGAKLRLADKDARFSDFMKHQFTAVDATKQEKNRTMVKMTSTHASTTTRLQPKTEGIKR